MTKRQVFSCHGSKCFTLLAKVCDAVQDVLIKRQCLQTHTLLFKAILTDASTIRIYLNMVRTAAKQTNDSDLIVTLLTRMLCLK